MMAAGAPKVIRTSYSIVTPDSVDIGDIAESGWIDEDGEDVADDDGDSVAGAIAFLRNLGAEPSSSAYHDRVWYSGQPETDYYTGSAETRAYHLDGFTDAEQRAIYAGVTAPRRGIV